MLLGAIDVGTNSIHLVVVELDPHLGTSRVLRKAREMVRLGAGNAFARGALGKKAFARGVAAIARFAKIAYDAGATRIRAVATSAVRDATNRAEFLEAVRLACGVELEILRDVDEARLIHLGVSRGFEMDDRLACIVDIGGGSTELIVADRHRPYLFESMRIGSLRMYEEHVRDAKDPAAADRAVRSRVAEALAPFLVRTAALRVERAIGTSGSVMSLATLDAASRGIRLERAHGYVLRRDRLEALQLQLLGLSPAERRKLPGMNSRRADIVTAGNAILVETLHALDVAEVVVCDRALREGLVVETLERDVAFARGREDARLRRHDVVHALARRFGIGEVHEAHVAELALDLFDELRAVHGYGTAERDALFAAAILHDVGRAIGASGHHKHGAYVVRNAPLPEWTAGEVALIAALVRYHRKSLPKPAHPEYPADVALRRKVVMLGALLRIAEGLDRRHLGIVGAPRVELTPGSARITMLADQDATPELEAAAFKSDLFARAFERTPTFGVRERDGTLDEVDTSAHEYGESEVVSA